MRVHITDLKSGDVLTDTVFNHYGLPILSSGTVLQGDEISKLFRHHVDFVNIERPKPKDPGLADTPEPAKDSYSEYVIHKFQPLFEDAIAGVEDLFLQAAEKGQYKDSHVEEHFIPLVENFTDHKDVVSLLITLNGKDNYTCQHSVQVGTIAYYIATWLGYSDEESLYIGKAGYLHDIGKSQISETILRKPGKLTDEEYEIMKRHASYSYDIVMRSVADEELAKAVLGHHERENGQGYPGRREGAAIHPISKIIAVADVYSAMISRRVYQKEKDLMDVLKSLHQLSFGELDPVIVQTFIHHMLPHFIGKPLKLTNGQEGTIVLINPANMFRPLIRLGNEFIDMEKRKDLEIDLVYL